MDDTSRNGSIFTFQPSSLHEGPETTVEGGQLLQIGDDIVSTFQLATADPAMTATINTVDTMSTNDEVPTSRTAKVALLPRIIDNTLNGAQIVLAEGMRNGDAIPVLRTALAELQLPDSKAEPGLIASVQHVLSALLSTEEAARQKKAQDQDTVKRILNTFYQTDRRPKEVPAKKGGPSEGDAVDGLIMRIRIAAVQADLEDLSSEDVTALAKAMITHCPGWVDREMLVKVVNQL